MIASAQHTPEQQTRPLLLLEDRPPSRFTKIKKYLWDHKLETLSAIAIAALAYNHLTSPAGTQSLNHVYETEKNILWGSASFFKDSIINPITLIPTHLIDNIFFFLGENKPYVPKFLCGASFIALTSFTFDRNTYQYRALLFPHRALLLPLLGLPTSLLFLYSLDSAHTLDATSFESIHKVYQSAGAAVLTYIFSMTILPLIFHTGHALTGVNRTPFIERAKIIEYVIGAEILLENLLRETSTAYKCVQATLFLTLPSLITAWQAKRQGVQLPVVFDVIADFISPMLAAGAAYAMTRSLSSE